MNQTNIVDFSLYLENPDHPKPSEFYADDLSVAIQKLIKCLRNSDPAPVCVD